MKSYAIGAGVTALLFASGCAHNARVNSVNLAEAGTYVVTTPGALTIARQNATSPRTCTLRTGGHEMGKHMHHGNAGPPGKHGMPGMRDGRGMGGGPPGGGGAGPAALLDTLLFRLCEARANNDITPEQYAASVQVIFKTMSDMAEHHMPPPGPGMRGPWGPPGPQGRDWGEHMRRDRDHGDRDDHDRGDRGDRDDKGGPGRDQHDAGPPHKDDDKPKGK